MFKTIFKAAVVVCAFIGAGYIFRTVSPEFAVKGFIVPYTHYFMTYATAISLVVVGLAMKMKAK
jgi:hypothetical protein